jgi:hypothetical protein
LTDLWRPVDLGAVWLTTGRQQVGCGLQALRRDADRVALGRVVDGACIVWRSPPPVWPVAYFRVYWPDAIVSVQQSSQPLRFLGRDPEHHSRLPPRLL